MLEFFMNHLATILICLVLIVIVALIIRKLILDRKRGKSSCGCGCQDCPGASFCHPADQTHTTQ